MRGWGYMNVCVSSYIPELVNFRLSWPTWLSAGHKFQFTCLCCLHSSWDKTRAELRVHNCRLLLGVTILRLSCLNLWQWKANQPCVCSLSFSELKLTVEKVPLLAEQREEFSGQCSKGVRSPPVIYKTLGDQWKSPRENRITALESVYRGYWVK